MLGDEKIAVIGSGSMGTALALAAATAGHPAAVWCPDGSAANAVSARFHGSGARGLAAPVRASTVMADVVGDAALIIVAVPSQRFRAAARALGSLAIGGRPLLSSTKGFEPDTHARMSEILADEVGSSAVGAIAGANVTHEMVAGGLTTLVVASPATEVGALARRCLESRQLQTRVHEDLLSIELAAALKNVVAVGVGIATGLELGHNARAIVFACGLQEIIALGAALGADASVFAGLAGVGDLYLTASSPDSLNRQLGIELGRGGRLADIVAALPEVPEGIGSVRACRALARQKGLQLPIAEAIAAILDGERDPATLEAACRDVSFA